MLDTKTFEDFLKQQKEPEQTKAKRREAFALAQTLPMPLSRFSRLRLRTDFSKLDISKLHLGNRHREMQPSLQGGVVVKYGNDVVYEKEDENKLSLLHRAFGVGDSFRVLAHKEIEKPIEIHEKAHESSAAYFFTHVIHLEKGARATFIYDIQNEAADSLVSNRLFVSLEEGAELELVTISGGRGMAWQYGNEVVKLGAKSRLTWIDIARGKGVRQVSKRAILEGNESEARFYGMFALGDGDHFDFIGGLEHQGVRTLGDVLIKGTLTTGAEVVFEGILKVLKTAQKTESSLYDHTLVLSPGVKMDSVPGLEIEANDVRVRHGASASPINEEQLFYLQSRGLSVVQAREMIIKGFTQPIFDHISTRARMAVERVIEFQPNI